MDRQAEVDAQKVGLHLPIWTLSDFHYVQNSTVTAQAHLLDFTKTFELGYYLEGFEIDG